MKRIFPYILLAAAVLLAAAGCKKDEPLPTVQFGAALYTVYSHGSVQVAVLTEAPVEKDLVVPVYFGGAAVKETDYSVSADAVTIAAGADTGYLEITDIALSEEKQIVLTLEAPDGYDTGLRAKAVVSPVAEEALIYSFETPAADLLESYTATVTVTGAVSGKSFKATEDLEIPLVVHGDGAGAVRASSVRIAAGQASGQAVFSLTDPAYSGMAPASVSADPAGSRFLPGDTGSLLLTVRGIQTPDKLLGTWQFDHIVELAQIEEWFLAMEDDPAIIPKHNDGFTLTFAKEGDNVVLTPGTSGDFAAFFRKATVTLTAPKNSNGPVLGTCTADDNNGWYAEAKEAATQQNTYYKLSQANRSFDNTAEKPGEAVVVFRLRSDGNLAVELRDYDAPPFGFMWWDDKKFDIEMFSFASVFTPVR